MTARARAFRLDVWAVVVLLPLLAVPFAISNPLALSLAGQIAIGVSASLGVYIMLRLGLLAFTVPAFMAIGGYAAAMLAKAGVTDLLALLAIAFVVPALVAVPLGALVLRLKGSYFIFITYICNEILQLLLFETPGLTGGSDGISDVPPATLFGFQLSSSSMLVMVTVAVGIIAALVTLLATQRFRPEFSAIEENETLAESLGVPIWIYRTIGFVVSAGVSGLAGFALVNMLSTANPNSFSSFSAITYISYVFIGGRLTMLGPVLGSALLIIMSNLFSSQAQLASGMFGLLLIAVMMVAPSGLVGLGRRLLPRRGTGSASTGQRA